nr:hypothetical protein [Tanacetum cinerariifolium]
MHLFQMKKLSLSSRNLGTKVLIRSDSQEHKYYEVGAVTPKKTRNFKKPASLSKKKALVAVKEPAEKPVKKPAARIQSAESEVPDEPNGKSIDTSEGTGLKLGVLDVSKADSSKSKYESWRDSDDDDNDQQSDDESTESDDEKSVDLNMTDDEEEDKFVHTPDDYVPIVDKIDDVDDEEFDRIGETEIISMMDIKVQHEDPKATTLTTFVPDFETLAAIHLRVSDLEKEVKELKNVNYSSVLRTTTKFKVPAAVKEYLGTSLDEALYESFTMTTLILLFYSVSLLYNQIKNSNNLPLFDDDKTNNVLVRTFLKAEKVEIMDLPK